MSRVRTGKTDRQIEGFSLVSVLQHELPQGACQDLEELLAIALKDTTVKNYHGL